MDFNEVFPLKFCINLGRREDRRLEAEAKLADAGIRAERFPAVDARWVEAKRRKAGISEAAPPRPSSPTFTEGTGPILPVKGGSLVRGYESAGRYALALTQRLAIREAARRRAPSVLLLEDDVVFHPNFRALIAMVELPSDWGIFYLGCTHNVPPVWSGTRVVRARWAVDTHAIAFSSTYYRVVMHILNRYGKEAHGVPKASDQFVALLQKEVPTYACYPNLAWQDEGGSDLLGVNYSSYGADGLQRNWTDAVVHLLPELIGETIKKDPSAEIGRIAPFVTVGDGQKLSVQVQRERVPLCTWKQKPPKLALLFLTRRDVNHPKIWREFIEEEPEGARVFSHMKWPDAVRQGFLASTNIQEHFPTEWGGIGLVKATRSLLLEALQDKTLTHFVLLSESCVPIRPLREILRRLELDPSPQFGFERIERAHLKHIARAHAVPQVPAGCWRFQSQWWLLDRVAAVFAAGEDYTELFANMMIPDEAYFATVLSLQGYPLEGVVLRKDVTWTWWKGDGSPVAWPTMPRERLAEMIHSGAFFARKFPKGADIGGYGLHLSIPRRESL